MEPISLVFKRYKKNFQTFIQGFPDVKSITDPSFHTLTVLMIYKTNCPTTLSLRIYSPRVLITDQYPLYFCNRLCIIKGNTRVCVHLIAIIRFFSKVHATKQFLILQPDKGFLVVVNIQQKLIKMLLKTSQLPFGRFASPN